MEKRIEDLKKGDIIKGIYANLQVISNNKGLLYLYNELTQIFFEADYKKYIKNGAKMEVINRNSQKNY